MVFSCSPITMAVSYLPLGPRSLRYWLSGPLQKQFVHLDLCTMTIYTFSFSRWPREDVNFVPGCYCSNTSIPILKCYSVYFNPLLISSPRDWSLDDIHTVNTYWLNPQDQTLIFKGPWRGLRTIQELQRVRVSVTGASQSFPTLTPCVWSPKFCRGEMLIFSADRVKSHKWNALQWIAQVPVVLLLYYCHQVGLEARRDGQGPATLPSHPETMQLQGLLAWWRQTREEDRQAGDRDSKQIRADWDLGISLSSLNEFNYLPWKCTLVTIRCYPATEKPIQGLVCWV